MLVCDAKSGLLLLAASIGAGCSAHEFATPYVLLSDGYRVNSTVVALSVEGEVRFGKGSCTGDAMSPVLHLAPGQALRIRGAIELLRKLPGEESEIDRHQCPDDETFLKVGINESSGVRRWWSACYSPGDPTFERLPRPFQEILRVIRGIPESSYSPLFVFLH